MSLLDGTDARTRAKRRKLPAAIVAHQFKPGQVGNPLGAGAIPKDRRELYRLARRKALDAAPEAIDIQIALMHCEDPRVAIIATNSVLDRAGVRAIDKPEIDDDTRERFDPSLLTPRELDRLEAALRLYLKAMVKPDAAGKAIDGDHGDGEPSE